MQALKKPVFYLNDVKLKKKKPDKKGQGYYFDKQRHIWIVSFVWGNKDNVLIIKRKA